jgi:protein subunit release factor B
VVLLKWSFVSHTPVNVLLEKEGKYAGIYSRILAVYCFEYSTARVECSVRRNISHSTRYSKEKSREFGPPCEWERKVAS